MTRIHIDCPEEVATGQSRSALEKLAQGAFLVRLYQLGQISSGRAAETLQISRREFLNMLADHGVSIFDEDTDATAEARRGRQ
jgi:predicted HTH domain antitoxin